MGAWVGHSLSMCTGACSILGSWLIGQMDLVLSPGRSSTSKVGCPAYLEDLVPVSLWGGSYGLFRRGVSEMLGANCIWGTCYKCRFTVPYLLTVIQGVWYSISDAQYGLGATGLERPHMMYVLQKGSSYCRDFWLLFVPLSYKFVHSTNIYRMPVVCQILNKAVGIQQWRKLKWFLSLWNGGETSK